MGIVLAITGGIGSGKSQVAKALKENGYFVLDGDSVAKEVLYNEENLPHMEKIMGDKLFNEKGVLKKNLIRYRLFTDESVRARVNELVKRVVLPSIMKQISERNDEPCFVEMANLFDVLGKEWEDVFDGCIGVFCKKEVAKERVSKRNPDLSPKQIETMMEVQSDGVKKTERFASVLLDTTYMYLEDYPLWVSEHWPKRQ